MINSFKKRYQNAEEYLSNPLSAAEYSKVCTLQAKSEKRSNLSLALTGVSVLFLVISALMILFAEPHSPYGKILHQVFTTSALACTASIAFALTVKSVFIVIGLDEFGSPDDDKPFAASSLDPQQFTPDSRYALFASKLEAQGRPLLRFEEKYLLSRTS
ncbi:hypothetical protein ACI2KR_08590 [Pseudomonas luteola]